MKNKALFIFAIALSVSGCFSPELHTVTLKVAGIKGDKLTFEFAKPKNAYESAHPAFNCDFNAPVNYGDVNAIRGLKVEAEIYQRTDGTVTICRLLADKEIKDKLASL